MFLVNWTNNWTKHTEVTSKVQISWKQKGTPKKKGVVSEWRSSKTLTPFCIKIYGQSWGWKWVERELMWLLWLTGFWFYVKCRVYRDRKEKFKVEELSPQSWGKGSQERVPWLIVLIDRRIFWLCMTLPIMQTVIITCVRCRLYVWNFKKEERVSKGHLRTGSPSLSTCATSGTFPLCANILPYHDKTATERTTKKGVLRTLPTSCFLKGVCPR
jgi:hypothetical protein